LQTTSNPAAEWPFSLWKTQEVGCEELDGTQELHILGAIRLFSNRKNGTNE
jgi:hypothetical protein